MKIVSLNIEGNRHYDRIIPFLHQEDFDVICLQEVLMEDIPRITKEFPSMISLYKPFTSFDSSHENHKTMNGKIFGTMILSKIPGSLGCHYYWGSETQAMLSEEALADEVKRQNYVLVWISLHTEVGKEITVATTHFPVTNEGESTPHQLEIIEPLSENLDQFEHVVMMGDFNAPRGGETFTELAKRYKDNIPEKYKTSIDQNLHRVTGLQYMVDGCFSRGGVTVYDVSLRDGLSDHMAVIASIS